MTKPLIALFKFEDRIFAEIPDTIVKMANIKHGECRAPELAPNGDIVLKRMGDDSSG